MRFLHIFIVILAIASCANSITSSSCLLRQDQKIAMPYRPALVQSQGSGQVENPEPVTPKQNSTQQNPSPALARHSSPKYGWCPMCEFGHKVLGKVSFDGGNAVSGQRRFLCSNRDRGCMFFELIPGHITLLTENGTPTRSGNCPNCRKGNLIEMVNNPWDFRDRYMMCDRKDALERPCSYRKALSKPKPPPISQFSSMPKPPPSSQFSEGPHLPGHAVVASRPSPIQKQPNINMPANHPKSSAVQMTRSDRRPTHMPSPESPPATPAEVGTKEAASNDIKKSDATALYRSTIKEAGRIPAQNPSIPVFQQNTSKFTDAPKPALIKPWVEPNVLGRPISSKPSVPNQPKNPVASTSQWLRRGPSTNLPLEVKGPKRSASEAAVEDIPLKRFKIIDLTDTEAKTPARPLANLYPTPQSGEKTAANDPVATPATNRAASEEFDDFGLDDEDLLEVAEQVELSRKRARSQSTDYGSLDEEVIEELIALTDEAVFTSSMMTPARKKLAGGSNQAWTPQTLTETPSRYPVSSAAPGPIAGSFAGASRNLPAKGLAREPA